VDDLNFDEHARDEMARDSVSADDVHLIVGDYDERYERGNAPTRYERILDDGRLIVVMVDEPARTVRTVWWDKRNSRRWRRR
jgi:hypothetical protein